MPIWVRLPNLPLHLWMDFGLEEMGEALGYFLMVDFASSNMFHSTYAWILLDIDASKGLSVEIKLCTPKGSWIQILDYEGLPYRCKKCYKTSRVAAKCDIDRVKSKRPSSWWKGAL